MSPLSPITTMPYLLVRRMRGCVRSPQVTNRAKAGGRRRPADHLLRPPRYLLAAPCQGVDGDGQQHLQRLAHGRRLARQVTRRGTAAPGRQRSYRYRRYFLSSIGDSLLSVVILHESSANGPARMGRAGFVSPRDRTGGSSEMKRDLPVLVAAGPLLLALSTAQPAFAQKAGGILKIGHFDSPASMSMLEESTAAVNRPMMGVFNNLVIFKQDVPQNTLRSIVPELAAGWAWNEEGTELTFPLRQGIKWHDGKPFTAADVKCTIDLLQGTGSEKLRINPRKTWFSNVEAVTTNGDYEVTFHLKRPQASFLAMLATGWSPIYPCHVPPAQMRLHPIGTGPFKFGEFRPNEIIKVARNPDYWKPGRPYLDGIDWRIIKDVSTRLLSFISGNEDVYFAVTMPQLKDVKSQVPGAMCAMYTGNVPRNLLVNRNAPPFDNPDLRRAMSLSIDHQVFIDILGEGKGDIGGVMQPPPSGVWGMPPEMLRTLPGYDPDVAKSRAEARGIME